MFHFTISRSGQVLCFYNENKCRRKVRVPLYDSAEFQNTVFLQSKPTSS